MAYAPHKGKFIYYRCADVTTVLVVGSHVLKYVHGSVDEIVSLFIVTAIEYVERQINTVALELDCHQLVLTALY